MEKRAGSGWQCHCLACIVCALCYAATMSAEENTSLEAVPVVSQGTIDGTGSAEQRSAELSAALARSERDLENLRCRYADLYLESREQQQQLQDLNFQAAALLEGHGNRAPSQDMARVMARMSAQEAGCRSLCSSVREFVRYLDVVLEVLQPSDAVRHEVQSRVRVLENQCDRLSQKSPIVARRGDRGVPRRECRILAVSEELQILVLDGGFADGVAPGTVWRVLSDGTVVAKLKIVEVRPNLSAAMLVQGPFRTLAPGLLVRRGE